MKCRKLVQEWQRPEVASTNYSSNKSVLGRHVEPTHFLHSSLGSGAVDLSPPDPMCCCLEQITGASRIRIREPQMVQQPQPSSQAKLTRCSVRNKESDVDRADAIPGGASLNSTQAHSSAVPSFRGLASAPGQLQAAKRIPGLFQQVRMKRASDEDLPRSSKKPCVRPTLSAAFCTPSVQALSEHQRGMPSADMHSVSATHRQLPDQLSQENDAAPDMMMQHDEMLLCDETFDIMPCGMAPMPTTPTENSEPAVSAAGTMASLRFTPKPTSQLGGLAMLACSPPVHTPPECSGAVVDQPPGAPRKRTKSSSSFDSFDSYDACESAFAPRAPEWSPRSAVCRVLRFDDQMDE